MWLSAPTSNLSAASTRASAACCGVSKLVMLADGAPAGAFFAEGCCVTDGTDVHRRTPSMAPRIRCALDRFRLAVNVMFALLGFRSVQPLTCGVRRLRRHG